MKNKSGKRIALSVVTALTLFAAVPVYANTYEAVYDDAGLLSDEEQQALSEAVTGVEQTTGWEIFAVTTDDAQGKTTREYADDFYDTNAAGDDGIVFLIDMDNREVTISTAGEAIYYLNDDRIDNILDNCYGYVVDGEYAECFSSMLNDAEAYYDKGIPSNAHTYDEETGKVHYYHVLTAGEILFSVVLAAAVFAAIFFGITGKYRLKFGGGYQYDYHAFGKVNLSNQEDRFVNEVVTHRRIQTSSSGGSSGGSSHSGRSTVHHSSSGRSHGGGSRKF